MLSCSKKRSASFSTCSFGWPAYLRTACFCGDGMCRFDSIIKRGETAGQPPSLFYHTPEPFSMKLDKGVRVRAQVGRGVSARLPPLSW